MDNRIDAVYARQSVDKKDSISIESQLDFCKYALKGGSCKEYTDKGYSSKNTDRPHFQEPVRDIEKSLVKRVVVICSAYHTLSVCVRNIAVFSYQKRLDFWSGRYGKCACLYGYSIINAANGINVMILLEVYAEPLPYSANVAADGVGGNRPLHIIAIGL